MVIKIYKSKRPQVILYHMCKRKKLTLVVFSIPRLSLAKTLEDKRHKKSSEKIVRVAVISIS